MTAVVVEFRKVEKIGAKAIIADMQAEVIIFPGVRHERLVPDSVEENSSDSPSSPRRKKTS